MIRVTPLLFCAWVLSLLAAEAQCLRESEAADSLRVLAVETPGSTADVLEEFLVASRAARTCFFPEDIHQSAQWFSYELWSLFAMRRNEEVLAGVREYEEKVAGAFPGTDAVAYTYQGGALTRLSRLDEALAAYHRALSSSRSSGDPYRVSMVHVPMTELARRMNRVEDVFYHLDQADSAAMSQDFPQREYVRSNIAYFRADALLYYSDRLALLTDDAYRDVLRRLDEAFEWASRTGDRDLRDKLYHTRLTFDLRSGVSSQLRSQATSYFRQNIEGGRDRSEMTWLYLLARIADSQGESTRAVRYLLESYDLAQDFAELEYKARLASMLGHIHETLGNYDRAAAWYRAADAAFELHVRGSGGREMFSNMLTRTTEPVRNLALLQLRLGEVGAAFDSIEQARSQLLSHLRRQGSYASRSQDAHADSLATLLREVRAQRALGIGDDLHLSAVESHLQVDIKRTFPGRPEYVPVNMNELQARLREGRQVLLSYLIAPTTSSLDRPFDSYLFVVNKDTVAAIGLNIDAFELSHLVYEAFPVLDDHGDQSLNVSLEALNLLYDKLISPALPFIDDGDRLVITPDGVLFYVPFAAFVSEYLGKYDYHHARYLIHDHPVSIELSASLLLEPGGDLDETPSLSIISRSDFSASDDYTQNLADLPWIPTEVRSLQRAVRDSWVSTPQTATPDNLFEQLSTAGAVHIATHAIVDPSSMLNHSIILNPDSSRASGTVFSFDLLRRHFDTSLVFLSACATASGPLIAGDGLAGFQYGFRASGVGSVVATLWLVEDASMAAVSTNFYRNLTEGAHKDEALRHAQLVLIESGTYQAHPMFWAAPVLYGDSSPLPLRAAVNWAGIVIIVLSLIGASVVAAILFHYRKRTYITHEPAAAV